MEKYTWTTDETFAGEIKIAHYGAADMPNARVIWTVGDSCRSGGRVRHAGADDDQAGRGFSRRTDSRAP